MSTHTSHPHVPDQQWLFNLGMDLAELREKREEYVQKSRAVNTLKAYRYSWGVFADWCASNCRAALPAEAETIELFLTWAAHKRKYRVETMKLALSAIQDKHERENLASPLTAAVRSVMEGIVRDLRETRQGKDAVRISQLRKICRRLDDEDRIHIRDRAIILVGFASAWRRSELASSRVEHVQIEKQGARLWLPFAKGDQQGKGEETEIVYAKDPKLCPVRALRAWLKIRGSKPGPLFVSFNPLREITHEAISGQRIADILKAELQRIGEDPKRYGAHSMRAGMITAAAKKNVPLPAIMHHTRHKRVDTVIRYVRRELPFRANPLARVL